MCEYRKRSIQKAAESTGIVVKNWATWCVVDVLDRVFVSVVYVEGKELQYQACRIILNQRVTCKQEVTCEILKYEFTNNLEHKCNEDTEIRLKTVGVMTDHNDD